MKERILSGWTFTRTLYLLMGGALVVQSFMEHQWWGLAFGGYFASMGIFNFGCAAGGCYGGACYDKQVPVKAENKFENVEFEEIKSK